MKIVIFAGGFGTRMWPASRKSMPKQFSPIVQGKSFFEITLQRFLRGFDIQDIFVSTEARYVGLVRKQAPLLPIENIIAEPERRDMMAAVGLVSGVIEKKFGQEVMFFSWADHMVQDEKKFLEKVKIALDYSKKTGVSVSLDEEPSFPTVHNGWLRRGKRVGELAGEELYEIRKHIEKPRFSVAKKLFKTGDYLIHTGYGAWRSDVMLGYYKKYAPETYIRIEKIMNAYGTDNWESALRRNYSKIEKTSVDIGIFEKIPSGARLTIPMNVGWQDAGTWELLYEAMAQNEETYLTGGADFEEMDGGGNFVMGQKGKIIAIIGLSGIVVVDTKDGLLISKMDKTKNVKELFSKMEKSKPKYVD